MAYMSVQLRHRPDVHRLFLLMLTDSVNQMFKSHQMLYEQFRRYREVLGSSPDDDNLLLCGNFGAVVLVGAYKARLIGVDVFSDGVDHVCETIFMWACLQTRRVLQALIDLEFIAHSEIGDVVVENLVNTKTPMSIHASPKTEKADLKSQM
jgi:hypothetical protein